jgi:hypothetical protein
MPLRNRERVPLLEDMSDEESGGHKGVSSARLELQMQQKFLKEQDRCGFSFIGCLSQHPGRRSARSTRSVGVHGGLL